MAELPTTMRAVRFESWGDRSVLQVQHVPLPEVAPGRVLVQVRAAGTNPGEAAIRSGAFDRDDPSKLPSGQGTDFAGVVMAVGQGVESFAVGDEVLGWSWERSSQAEFVSVPETQLVPKPAGLSWEVAGSMDVAGTTAYAAVRAVDPQPGETVVVSAAAGGVGGFVTQLALLRGARVIALAGEANHEWLRERGAESVTYGEGMRERIEQLAPDGVDALIDTFGAEYVQLGLDLGVDRQRINTIIAFAFAAETGVQTQGSAEGADPSILSELAELAASGTIVVPIAATYPLEGVQAAYAEVEQRHTRGKVVLVP